MPSPSPEAVALLVSLGGGGLAVAAVWGLGCLYAKVYNWIRRRT